MNWRSHLPLALSVLLFVAACSDNTAEIAQFRAEYATRMEKGIESYVANENRFPSSADELLSSRYFGLTPLEFNRMNELDLADPKADEPLLPFLEEVFQEAVARYNGRSNPTPGAERSAIEQAASKQAHYEIDGFYVFPLKNVLLGQTPEQVATTLGKPPLILKTKFQKPNRVNLAILPEFDEQWGYGEELAYNWVFFHDSKVVAAFREESDW